MILLTSRPLSIGIGSIQYGIVIGIGYSKIFLAVIGIRYSIIFYVVIGISYSILCTVDDLGQIFDLLSGWKLESKNAPRDLKFNHNVAI